MAHASQISALSDTRHISRITPYDEVFFLAQQDASSRSARIVAPLVLSLTRAESVIDVGCGVGTWASEFLRNGAADVLGIDGDYVNREMLKIPASCFAPHDLTQPISIGRRFDLAVCLEVAEHLPAVRAEGLVEDLTRLAPVVLFSAAIPGQGGTHHINEQYLSYWARLFAGRGCVLLDIIRPAIWAKAECDGCYRQNAVIFAAADHPLAARPRVDSGVDCIHPYLYGRLLAEFSRPRLGYLLRSIPGSISRSLSYRWRQLMGRTEAEPS